MKFQLIKTILITTLLAFSFASENEEKVECDNPCVACQRAIYQLKFQKIADCGNTHCKNTCYKIRELWNNSPDGIFRPFEKDIFGKCEICFRAGYCSIAECKAQEEMELNIISEVVNKKKLTAKKSNIVADLGFNQFHEDVLFYNPDQLKNIYKNLDEKKEEISENLNASFAKKSAKGAIEEVETILGNLFEKDKTFSGKVADKPKDVKSSIAEEKTKVSQFVDATDMYIKHVKKIIELQKKAKSNNDVDASQKKKISEVSHEAKKDVAKKILDNKKILKNAKKTNKLQVVKGALKDSIGELRKLETELHKN